MNKYIKKAILASAGAALFYSTASAAPVLYADQDLILSFRKAGSANDFNVDLGQVSQFSASSSFGLGTVGFSGTDLKNAFGNNLNGVVWTAWAGNYQTGLGRNAWLINSANAAWNGLSSTLMRNMDSAINNFGGQNIGGSTSVAVGSSGTEYQNASSGSFSYTTFTGTINGTFPEGTTDVGDGVNFLTTGYLSTIANVNGAAGTLLGSISFDPTTGAGTWMGVSAVPESGTYGIIAGVGLLALALRRQFGAQSV